MRPLIAMAMRELIETVRALGLRMTSQRREILRLLLDADGHLTAQEVHERLRPLFPEVSLDTVYRTLRTFAGVGIVCQSHLQTRHPSRFSLASGRHHHHHMVCVDCGHAIEFAECLLPVDLEEISTRHDFRPSGHAFEVYGTCGRCAEAGGGR